MEAAISNPATNVAAAHAGLNVRRLFVLSCLCLATTSMSFILRGSIADEL